MTACAPALLLAWAAATPSVVAPGDGAQTTRPRLRLFVEAEGTPTVKAGNATGSCETGARRARIAHCVVELAPGANPVVVADAGGETRLTVHRYLTTGPLVAGVELLGFGVGTVHRREVERVCAGCHKMDEAKDRPPKHRFEGGACLACHGEITRREKQHGPVGQGACLMCHDAASAPQRYQVGWPIQETCFRCHHEIRQQMQAKAFRHGPTAAGRCTTCHDPHGTENAFWLKKPVWALCTHCHPEKASDRHVVVGFVFGDSHPTRGREHPLKPAEFYCSSCHNPHAAQARYLWQFDATSREVLCQTCHRK